MAVLNKSSTGQPYSSSSPTLPKNDAKFLSKFASLAFERYRENKAMKAKAKSVSKAEHEEKVNAMKEREKQIDILKDEIRKLQNDSLSPEERDKLLNKILTKEQGALPKETVEKLKRQQEKLKKRMEMAKEEFSEGITEENKDKIDQLDKKIAELMKNNAGGDKNDEIERLIKKRKELYERPTMPIMPQGVSTEDKEKIAEINKQIEDLKEKEIEIENPNIARIEQQKREELEELQHLREQAEQDAMKNMNENSTQEIQEIIADDGDKIIKKANDKFDASVEALAGTMVLD